tara:strand:+ start:417 stop:926 length:510 start_codon:yes stop_codon:yes gene_type:complete
VENPKKLKVVGLKELQRAFTEIGETRKKARTQINKALRPAAQVAQRAAKQKYKLASKHDTPGKRQDPNTGKSIIGRTLADSMQVIVATKSREPGLLVGPRVKGKFASANWSGKGAVNLAELLVRGNKNLPNQTDHLLEVAKSKGNQVLQVAQRDIGRLFDKIFIKAGFR